VPSIRSASAIPRYVYKAVMAAVHGGLVRVGQESIEAPTNWPALLCTYDTGRKISLATQYFPTDPVEESGLWPDDVYEIFH